MLGDTTDDLHRHRRGAGGLRGQAAQMLFGSTATTWVTSGG